MSDNTQGQAAPSQAAPAVAQAEEIQGQVEQNLDSETDGGDETVDASSEKNEAEAILEDPKASKKEKEVAKKQLKKLKLKVDGKEIIEEYDPNDDEYMVKQLQMAKLGQKRASEKAQLDKQIAAFIEELKNNPRKVLEDPSIGVDMKKFVEAYIDEQFETARKTPEQIEREKMAQELKSLKEERERERKDAEERERERLNKSELERYDMLMTKALESHLDLPKSPYVIKKMADYMLVALNEGISVDPEDVIPFVREEMRNDIKHMLPLLPDDVAEELVGKDFLNRLRKKNVAKAKAAPATPAAKQGIDTGDTAKKDPKEPIKKKTIKELWGV